MQRGPIAASHCTPAGVHLPMPHSGRASFIIKGFMNQAHDSWGARLPTVLTRISGPKSDLWKRVTGAPLRLTAAPSRLRSRAAAPSDFQFKDDVDFLGEGFGEYSLCVSLQSGAGAVAVEVNLFAPFVGMVDPRTVSDVAADGKDAKAVAEDVAMAESAVRRLKADLRVRPCCTQPPARCTRFRALTWRPVSRAPRSAS